VTADEPVGADGHDVPDGAQHDAPSGRMPPGPDRDPATGSTSHRQRAGDPQASDTSAGSTSHGQRVGDPQASDTSAGSTSHGQRVGDGSEGSGGGAGGDDVGAARPARRERRQVLLRLDPAVHDALARWAADDLRSVNAQIDLLLRRALKDAGRMPDTAAAPARRGRPRATP